MSTHEPAKTPIRGRLDALTATAFDTLTKTMRADKDAASSAGVEAALGVLELAVSTEAAAAMIASMERDEAASEARRHPEIVSDVRAGLAMFRTVK